MALSCRFFIAALALLSVGCPGVRARGEEAPAVNAALTLPEAPGIECPGKGDCLAPLWARLSALGSSGSGLVRIGHFGDSHVAADIITNYIRKRLTGQFGDGGRGWVMFGRPFSSYRPRGARTKNSKAWTASNVLYSGTTRDKAGEGIFGLGGFSLCTSKPRQWAFIELANLTAEHRIRVYYARRPGGGTMSLTIGDQPARRIRTRGEKNELAWVDGVLSPGATPRIQVDTRGDGPVCVFGATLERGGPGVIYEELGVNGARFNALIGHGEPWFPAMLAQRNYDLVIFSYGANEAFMGTLDLVAYRKVVDQGLGLVLAAGPAAVCLLTSAPLTAVGKEKAYSETLDQIIQVHREAAAARGCAFLDLNRLMGGGQAMAAWLTAPREVLKKLWDHYNLKLDGELFGELDENFKLYQKDGVHLTTEGYWLLGELITQLLLDRYNSFLLEH